MGYGKSATNRKKRPECAVCDEIDRLRDEGKFDLALKIEHFHMEAWKDDFGITHWTCPREHETTEHSTF